MCVCVCLCSVYHLAETGACTLGLSVFVLLSLSFGVIDCSVNHGCGICWLYSLIFIDDINKENMHA